MWAGVASILFQRLERCLAHWAPHRGMLNECTCGYGGHVGPAHSSGHDPEELPGEDGHAGGCTEMHALELWSMKDIAAGTGQA